MYYYSWQLHNNQLAYKIAGGDTNVHIHARYNYSLIDSHYIGDCSLSSVDFSVVYVRGLKVTKTPSLATIVTPCTCSKGTLVIENCSIL